MKGIILAGGSGTRLYPITEGVSKQLLPIYDKPMIYYPISTLMMSGIRDILIITTRDDQEAFKRLLKDGHQFGVNFEYAVQEVPNGLAQAFVLGKDFIGSDTSAMVLGDNIFYGSNLKEKFERAKLNAENGYATIFGYQVKDPERFGIMELDKNNNVIGVEEKPENPKSDYAITGLYFYPNDVTKEVKKVVPSKRCEYEITDLNKLYLQRSILKAELLNEGYTWYDTGTFDSLNEAADMVKSIETQGDRVICCPEKIGYDNNWLSKEELEKRSELLQKNSYGKYLKKVLRR